MIAPDQAATRSIPTNRGVGNLRGASALGSTWKAACSANRWTSRRQHVTVRPEPCTDRGPLADRSAIDCGDQACHDAGRLSSGTKAGAPASAGTAGNQVTTATGGVEAQEGAYRRPDGPSGVARCRDPSPGLDGSLSALQAQPPPRHRPPRSMRSRSWASVSTPVATRSSTNANGSRPAGQRVVRLGRIAAAAEQRVCALHHGTVRAARRPRR